MQDTINRLNFEMQDAQRNLDWISKEKEALEEKRREAYRNYYRAKGQLKQLTDKQQAA